MTEEQQIRLKEALETQFHFSPTALAAAIPLFHCKKLDKGDFYNLQRTVCKHLAFVDKGFFRVYLPLEDASENNFFFFRETQFMGAFKSFITQTPCVYNMQALEDAEIIQISYHDLNSLYEKHLDWANFGRVLAEQYFFFTQKRIEDLMLKSAEERYLELLQFHPDIFERATLSHISSFLGIKGPSLSRIRKKISSGT